MMAADKAEQAVNVEQWQAINERDGHFDGQFYYADRNTQLYCKPSCPTQIPKFNHVCIDVASGISKTGLQRHPGNGKWVETAGEVEYGMDMTKRFEAALIKLGQNRRAFTCGGESKHGAGEKCAYVTIIHIKG